MHNRPVRTLRHRDAMILVGATAVGLGWARQIMMALQEYHFSRNPPEDATEWGTVYTCVAVAWSVTLVVLRFVPPRPSLCRIRRQPGMVACCAVVLALAIGSLCILLNLTIYERRGDGYPWPVMYVLNPEWISSAVAGAWLAQAMGRRWRPEPCWIDRAGRVLAIGWFAVTALHCWFG